MSNDISFKMNINIVDAAAFDRIKGGANIDWRPPHKLISKYKELKDLGLGSLIGRQDVLKADEFKTLNIRTCTGGLTSDSKTGTGAGFHYFDDAKNYEDIGGFLKYLFNLNPNPDRAFLVGGKNLSKNEYSLPIMNLFLEVFKIKIPNLTYFCEHRYPYSETDFHFSQKDDTVTVCSMFHSPIEVIERYVSSVDDLKKCYKRIHIADGDQLFINGKEVDTKQFKTDNI